MKAEIIDNTTNRVVVIVPGRNYPGLVVQGDTLRALNIMANSNDPFQFAQLRATLADLEEHYTEVCSRGRPKDGESSLHPSPGSEADR